MLTTALAFSVLLYFLGIVVPIRLSDWYGGLFYVLTGLLIAAVVDHGHAQTPWSIRWRRFAVSVVSIVAWFIAGAGMVSIFSGASFSLGRNGVDVWATVWPMIALAVVLAFLGMGLTRWMERRATTFDARAAKV